MKYKLLKDINGVDKGEEFIYLNSLKGFKGVTEIKELIQLIGIDNKDFFEEIKEPKSIYDLKVGDKYWYIDVNSFGFSFYYGDANSRDLEYGNVFLTREEAEQEIKKRKAMATIKKWSYYNDGGYEFKFGVLSYSFYVIENGEIKISNSKITNKYSTQYYSTKEKAEQALLELEAEYKILFNIG